MQSGLYCMGRPQDIRRQMVWCRDMGVEAPLVKMAGGLSDAQGIAADLIAPSRGSIS